LLLAGDLSDGTMLLARWDGTSTTTLGSFTPAPETFLAASATEAFVLTGGALYGVPLEGGATMKLRDLPSTASAQILGVNEESLFYSPEGTSIVRRALASGDEITLVDGIDLVGQFFGGGSHGWADATSLYFATGDPQFFGPTKLSRIGVAGGATETLWNVVDRHPTGAVATDVCNVYWLAASAADPQPGSTPDGPSILMFRAK
jgi:hypothetical protein